MGLSSILKISEMSLRNFEWKENGYNPFTGRTLMVSKDYIKIKNWVYASSLQPITTNEWNWSLCLKF